MKLAARECAKQLHAAVLALAGFFRVLSKGVLFTVCGLGAYRSDFENDWHNQRPPTGVLIDVTFQVLTDLLFDDTIVGFLFLTRLLQSTADYLSGLCEETVFCPSRCEAAHHNFGDRFDFARQLVDGDYGQNDAVFAEVTTIADHEILDHVAR